MGCKNLGTGLVAGIIIGAVAGLVFAPKKGEELRTDIKVKATDAYDKIVSYDYAGAKDNVINKFDEVKHKIGEISIDKFKDVSNESLDNFKNRSEELMNMAKSNETKPPVFNEEDEDLFEDL